jgi:hypothetical protein
MMPSKVGERVHLQTWPVGVLMLQGEGQAYLAEISAINQELGRLWTRQFTHASNMKTWSRYASRVSRPTEAQCGKVPRP